MYVTSIHPFSYQKKNRIFISCVFLTDYIIKPFISFHHTHSLIPACLVARLIRLLYLTFMPLLPLLLLLQTTSNWLTYIMHTYVNMIMMMTDSWKLPLKFSLLLLLVLHYSLPGPWILQKNYSCHIKVSPPGGGRRSWNSCSSTIHRNIWAYLLKL